MVLWPILTILSYKLLLILPVNISFYYLCCCRCWCCCCCVCMSIYTWSSALLQQLPEFQSFSKVNVWSFCLLFNFCQLNYNYIIYDRYRKADKDGGREGELRRECEEMCARNVNKQFVRWARRKLQPHHKVQCMPLRSAVCVCVCVWCARYNSMEWAYRLGTQKDLRFLKIDLDMDFPNSRKWFISE